MDTATKLLVATHIIQKPNDKLELEPTLENLAALPKELGTVTELIADSGYFSETNVTACEKREIAPYIAVGRDQHNQPLWDRFQEPPPLADDADPVTRMRHRLKTSIGKAIYALRKVTSEPVFGIIKQAMGFRSFLLRGHEAVESEWNLACLAYNIKRLYALNGCVEKERVRNTDKRGSVHAVRCHACGGRHVRKIETEQVGLLIDSHRLQRPVRQAPSAIASLSP